MKITLAEQVKILDDKIKANKAHCHLGSEAAKVTISSGELERGKCLNGEDLVYKPGIVGKVKFEYSSLGKVFNKGLDEKRKKQKAC